MEENNVVAVEDQQPVNNKPSFKDKFKEFCRRQMISLKRKPQNIAFLMVLITTIFNLLTLGTFSQAAAAGSSVDWVGLMVFVNTLFSCLIVVCFMNTFPKMKKYKSKTTITVNFTKASKININLIMAVITIAFAVVMIVCEFIFRSKMTTFYNENYAILTSMNAETQTQANNVLSSLTLSMVHIVLLIIDIVLFLLTPLFGKLFAKVDTNKHLESAVENMEEIDLASED